MNYKDRFLTEFDRKGKVFSACISVLTLFAIWGRFSPMLYDKLPTYTEWMTGTTTWLGYNKQADLFLIQFAIVFLPLFCLLTGVLYVYCKRILAEEDLGVGAGFFVGYLAVLGLYYLQSPHADLWLYLWILLFCGYLSLAKRKRANEFGESVIAAGVIYLAMVALIVACSAVIVRLGIIWDAVSPYIWILATIAYLFAIMMKKGKVKERILLLIQLVLPCAWLGFFHFRYFYEENNSRVELFFSGKWKAVCILACVILIIIGVIEKKKTSHTILFSTYVMTAVLGVFSQPKGLVNIDYFHNGEITMPMHQLVTYGKIPYKDLIPIHGLCDYYYGVINYLFFDGTYLSLNASMVVGNVLMAVCFATVLWLIMGNRMQTYLLVYFFVPFMVAEAGMRYWVMLLMFFVMFSGAVKKGMQSFYAWIWFCVLAISWNASIGGACALSFLPVVIYRLLRDIKWQWKEFFRCKEKLKKGAVIAAWVGLAGVCAAFLPLFLHIVEYLKDNTKTTIYVNGMEMMRQEMELVQFLTPGFAKGQQEVFLPVLAFLIPMFVTFVLFLRKKSHGAGEFFLTYISAYWILVNYAFVRYDEGLRARVLGICFLVITAMLLICRFISKKEEGELRMTVVLYTVFLAFALFLINRSPLLSSESLVLERKVPSYIKTTIMGKEIQDPVLHVTGELVGIENLGTGFIQGNTLLSLQNVNKVVSACENANRSVFDITNAVANAVILDMPMYLPYSSAYNISNDRMQEKAIAMLSENLPDVILAAPEIRFDDAPFSYRAIKLYRYLMKQGYEPYKYENVIYLVRGDNPLPEGERSPEAFAALMHKKDLGYLPAVWGNSNKNLLADMEKLSGVWNVQVLENGFALESDHAIAGEDIGVLLLSGILAKDVDEADSPIEVKMAVNGIKGDVAEFVFVLKGDKYILPLCCSPYVTEEAQIKRIEITSDVCEQIDAKNVKAEMYR